MGKNVEQKECRIIEKRRETEGRGREERNLCFSLQVIFTVGSATSSFAVTWRRKVSDHHVIFRLSKKDKLLRQQTRTILRKRAAQVGLKPATHCLLDGCSTTELPRQLSWLG